MRVEGLGGQKVLGVRGVINQYERNKSAEFYVETLQVMGQDVGGVVAGDILVGKVFLFTFTPAVRSCVLIKASAKNNFPLPLCMGIYDKRTGTSS